MQGELFHGMEKDIRHTEELEDEKPVERPSVFERFQVTLSFDKLVIASISMVVLLAVTFAMGVEKGKQKAAQANASVSGESSSKTVIQQEWSAKESGTKSEAQTDTSSGSTDVAAPSENSSLVSESTVDSKTALVITPKELAPASKPSKKAIEEQNKRYTIRLASYIKQTQAKTAATKLKKKGYSTFVKQSGKYFVVNVGRYSGKQDAQQHLLRLRKELGIGKEGFVLTA